MTNQSDPGPDRCPLCELELSEVLTVVSRHRTTTGTVVYARCECGRLSMWHEATAAVPRLRTVASRNVDCLNSLLDSRSTPPMGGSMPLYDYFRAPDADTVFERLTADSGSPMFPGDSGLPVLDGVAGKGVDPRVTLGALLELVGDGSGDEPRLLWPRPAPAPGAWDPVLAEHAGPWADELSKHTRDLLADIAEEDVAALAAAWCATEAVDEVDSAAATDWLHAMVALARSARDADESLFCWYSL